ncbi:hypothetical protein IV203_021499 [Nitzschia inconspicua]|uniref:Uncharacterized protein n=1 Tax=Nitzschia inconspicua TaxID=303405 RepID=A0A9K3KI72_9STRA|nr:hypothetical protein IV203_022697 [Nitzschia inconspicua]KAG7343554.1 hypothetical protein IV203_021499 [Nitzschia inconspicua]
MTSLQERVATELANFDDEFVEEDNSFSSGDEVEVANQYNDKEEEDDSLMLNEEEAAAATALRDQFLMAAAGPGVSKRAKKGAPRRSIIGPTGTAAVSVKKGDTTNATKEQQQEEVEKATRNTVLATQSQAESTSTSSSGTANRRPLRATKEDILNSLAANRERRQRQQQQQRGSNTTTTAAVQPHSHTSQSHQPEQLQQQPTRRNDRRRSSSIGRKTKSSIDDIRLMSSTFESSHHERTVDPDKYVRRNLSEDGTTNNGSFDEDTDNDDDEAQSSSQSISRSGRRRQQQRDKSKENRVQSNRNNDDEKEQDDGNDMVVDDTNTNTSNNNHSPVPESRGTMRRPSTDLKRMAAERRAVRRYKSEDLNPIVAAAKRTDSMVVTGTSQRGTTRRQFRAQRRTATNAPSEDTDNAHHAVSSSYQDNSHVSSNDNPSTVGDSSSSLLRSPRRGSMTQHPPTTIVEEEYNDTPSIEEQKKQSSTPSRQPRRGSGSGSRRRHKIEGTNDKEDNDSIGSGHRSFDDMSLGGGGDDDGTISSSGRNRRGRRRNEIEQTLRQHNKDDTVVDKTSDTNSATTKRSASPILQQRAKSPGRGINDKTARIRRRGGSKQQQEPNTATIHVSKERNDHIFERPRSLSVDSDDLGVTLQESEDENTVVDVDTYNIPTSVRVHRSHDTEDLPVKNGNNVKDFEAEPKNTSTVEEKSPTVMITEENEAEGAQLKPASRSLFKNILGRGKGKSKETTIEEPTCSTGMSLNEEDELKEEAAAAEQGLEEKESSSANRFKNMLVGRMSRGKDTKKDDPVVDDIKDTMKTTVQNDVSLAPFDQEVSTGSIDEEWTGKQEALKTAASRNKLKGLLPLGIKGSSTNDKEDATDRPNLHSQETMPSENGKRNGSKWLGLRGGMDFTTRLKLTQKDNNKKTHEMNEEDDADLPLEMESNESSNANSDQPDVVAGEDVCDTEAAPKSKKPGKWNFAAKLKKNLQQEQKPKEESNVRRKQDSADDEIPTDYGLMNSVNSFSDEDLEGLADIIPTDNEECLEQPPTADASNECPKIDRRMMMGGFQGQSTKFDFGKQNQDSAIVMRKSKEEASAEINDSNSSMDLIEGNSSVGTEKTSEPIDAFSLLNSSSSSSNPPERRMVFATTWLREPSQRFDFHKQSKQALPTPTEAQPTIHEGDESDDAPEGHMVFAATWLRESSQRFDFNKKSKQALPTPTEAQPTIQEGDECEEDDKDKTAVVEPVEVPGKNLAAVQETEPSPRPNFKSIEAELLKVVEKKKKKRRKDGRSVPKDLAEELKMRVSSHKSKADEKTLSANEEAITTSTAIEDDDLSPSVNGSKTIVKYPKLSSTQCVQLDFESGDEPRVCIHAMYEAVEGDEEQEDDNGHFLHLDGTGTPLKMNEDIAFEPAIRSASPSSPSSMAYERLLRELSDSEKRTRQAQETVRIMEKELQSKRRRYGELEARRRQQSQ